MWDLALAASISRPFTDCATVSKLDCISVRTRSVERSEATANHPPRAGEGAQLELCGDIKTILLFLCSLSHPSLCCFILFLSYIMACFLNVHV